MALFSLTSYSQNRCNIYLAGSLIHNCGGYFDWNEDGNTGFKWGGGAILGGGYELNFSEHWSFTPGIELTYTDNGAYYNKTGQPAYSNGDYIKDVWASSWSVNLPLTAGFRFPITNKVGFKIDAGSYLEEAFYVKQFFNVGTNSNPILEKKKVSPNFGRDFQFGFIGGVSVETGKHLSYFFQTRYPFLDKRWSTSNLSLVLGVKYSF